PRTGCSPRSAASVSSWSPDPAGWVRRPWRVAGSTAPTATTAGTGASPSSAATAASTTGIVEVPTGAGRSPAQKRPYDDDGHDHAYGLEPIQPAQLVRRGVFSRRAFPILGGIGAHSGRRGKVEPDGQCLPWFEPAVPEPHPLVVDLPGGGRVAGG